MYQWQKDGVDITVRANETAYIIPSVTESDEGEYQCVVSNAAGNAYVISDAAQLTLGEHIIVRICEEYYTSDVCTFSYEIHPSLSLPSLPTPSLPPFILPSFSLQHTLP